MTVIESRRIMFVDLKCWFILCSSSTAPWPDFPMEDELLIRHIVVVVPILDIFWLQKQCRYTPYLICQPCKAATSESVTGACGIAVPQWRFYQHVSCICNNLSNRWWWREQEEKWTRNAYVKVTSININNFVWELKLIMLLKWSLTFAMLTCIQFTL